jgi:uncharacterized protein YbjQ (UPF0145 family)
VPDLEEIRETVKDTVKDAAQQISDATKDAVQQLVQQSLLQLIETAKTLAEQAVVGVRHSAESVAVPFAEQLAGSSHAATPELQSAQATAQPVSDSAKAAAPDDVTADVETSEEERSGGGFLRFVFVGLILGALIAYFSQRGGEDDEDFGEENWIEVKHDESGSGPAHPDQATPASSASAVEPEAAPSQQELDARATDH